MSRLHLKIVDAEFDVSVSPSFLSEALCPFALKSHHVDHFRGPTNTALEVGSSVHAMFESIMKLRLANQPIDDVALEALYKENVSPAAIGEITEIRRMVNMYLTEFYVPLDTIVGVEEKIAFDQTGNIVPWNEAYTRAVLDLVQIKGDTGVITDYKTQYNILSQDELLEHKQLKFYACVLRRLYPHLRRFKGAIYFARHGFTVSVEFSIEALDVYETEVDLAVNQIAKYENFDPIPGEHCSICDAAPRCPLASDLGPVPATIATAEQAKYAANRLRVLELTVKDLKKKLRPWAAEHGEVALAGGFCYGFRTGTSTIYPTPAIQQVASQRKIDIAEYLKVDAKGFGKFLNNLKRSDPDTYVALAEVCPTTAKSRFDGHKIGGAGEEDDDQ